MQISFKYEPTGSLLEASRAPQRHLLVTDPHPNNKSDEWRSKTCRIYYQFHNIKQKAAITEICTSPVSLKAAWLLSQPNLGGCVPLRHLQGDRARPELLLAPLGAAAFRLL